MPAANIAGVANMATSLLSAATSGQATKQVYIVPTRTDGSTDTDIGVWAFQYWPETVAIGNSDEYAQRPILGASHPMIQWQAGGGRSISFAAEFTRDMQGQVVQPTGGGGIGGALVNAAQSVVSAVSNLNPFGSSKIVRDAYNVDIAQAIAWLESMKCADYGQQYPGGYDPPPTLLLVIPNSKLGRTYGAGPTDYINCVLTSCPTNIDAWFPDGTIRHARCDLTFLESAQSAYGINYMSRSNFATKTAGGQPYGVSVAQK